MNIRSADIEGFLRKEVDSSIRVQRTIGLDLGSKGVAFQYQSSEQSVWVVLEYTTAAALILAPSYAPLQAVEAIVARETFQDDELIKLNALHASFLLWLQENIDEGLEPAYGRFFSSSEPMPDDLSKLLRGVEAFGAFVSLMGYPKGALHIFTGLPSQPKSEDDATAKEAFVFESAQSDTDLEEASSGPSPIAVIFPWVVRALLLIIVIFVGWIGYEFVATQRAVVKTVTQPTAQVRTHQVRIPGGSFIMGCTQTDCAEDEQPHRVSITTDFFMLESEVTQQQYLALMNTNPSQNFQCGKECPVDSVTWENAVIYANRLSRHQDYPVCYGKRGDHWLLIDGCLGWRLPTEAEWERAALGVRNNKSSGAKEDAKIVPLEKTAWYVDKKITNELAMVTVTETSRQHEMLRLLVESQPVCSKARNGYGLCDMAGNLWEWTWDWYDPDMPVKTHNTKDPSGPLLGRTKVLKGGAFDSMLPDIYPHRRIHLAPWATMGEVRFASEKPSVDVLEGSVGFRLVRTAP
jgi:formylglycine-generating enzyme required for sulfatase activity